MIIFTTRLLFTDCY